ncbi:MAG: GNAT family N-acetyltransferase [Gaiellaceae bacterium]
MIAPSRDPETHWQVQREACVAGLAHIVPPERYPFPDHEVLRRWQGFEGTVFAAERDGAVVGIAGVANCWLHGFYVRPEWWGTGVADELHAAAVDAMPDCPELRLWVLEENHRARRFYEKHGWRPNGETRIVPYPPSPLDVGYSLVREEP